MTWKYSRGNDSHHKPGNKTPEIKLTRNRRDLHKIKTLPNDIFKKL